MGDKVSTDVGDPCQDLKTHPESPVLETTGYKKRPALGKSDYPSRRLGVRFEWSRKTLGKPDRRIHRYTCL